MSVLPASLQSSLEHPGALDLVLVVGAGCSTDSPTDLELGSFYAEEAHETLVRRGILAPLATPWDLSAVADAVLAAEGSQKKLVAELPIQKMKRARANDGYRIAAALQIDGFVRTVLSLNYDAAGKNAVAEMDTSETVEIHIVESIRDLPLHGSRSFIFLNGSASVPGDDLILTTTALNMAWRGSWQQVVTAQAMNVPVIAFVGLGSPAKLLSETLSFITAAVGDATEYVLVGPGDQTGSSFAEQIAVSPENCIDATWTDFMRACAEVACETQIRLLANQFDQVEQQSAVQVVPRDTVAVAIRELGLLGYGQLRKRWTFDKSGYMAHPTSDGALNRLADSIHFIAEAAMISGRQVHLEQSGDVRLEHDGSTRRMRIFAPDRKMDFEAAVSEFSTMQNDTQLSPPDLVVVSGTNAPIKLSMPLSIVGDSEDRTKDGLDIVHSSVGSEFRYMTDLRMNPEDIRTIIR